MNITAVRGLRPKIRAGYLLCYAVKPAKMRNRGEFGRPYASAELKRAKLRHGIAVRRAAGRWDAKTCDGAGSGFHFCITLGRFKRISATEL